MNSLMKIFGTIQRLNIFFFYFAIIWIPVFPYVIIRDCYGQIPYYFFEFFYDKDWLWNCSFGVIYILLFFYPLYYYLKLFDWIVEKLNIKRFNPRKILFIIFASIVAVESLYPIYLKFSIRNGNIDRMEFEYFLIRLYQPLHDELYNTLSKSAQDGNLDVLHKISKLPFNLEYPKRKYYDWDLVGSVVFRKFRMYREIDRQEIYRTYAENGHAEVLGVTTDYSIYNRLSEYCNLSSNKDSCYKSLYNNKWSDKEEIVWRAAENGVSNINEYPWNASVGCSLAMNIKKYSLENQEIIRSRLKTEKIFSEKKCGCLRKKIDEYGFTKYVDYRCSPYSMVSGKSKWWKY